ncbi:MAG: hypothetical protein L6W00_22925 [Lentisphaeria bacterium]|nr:MAG: hypothetical protein L6W00_22925 [Lentisphaeria bacterium]
MRTRPEILDADLAGFALELAAWGASPADLAWLDPPPEAGFAAARKLLTELGALDREGALTPRGRKLASLPVHPRLGMMLLRAAELGLAPLGAELAALLEERDVRRSFSGADLRERVERMRRHPGEFRNQLVIKRQLLSLLHEKRGANSGGEMRTSHRVCLSRPDRPRPRPPQCGIPVERRLRRPAGGGGRALSRGVSRRRPARRSRRARNGDPAGGSARRNGSGAAVLRWIDHSRGGGVRS